MWKLLSVLYFSLLVASVVKSHEVRNGSPIVEDTKLARHHHHHKTRIPVNETPTKTSNDDDGINANTTEETKDINERNIGKSMVHNSSVNSEEIDHENVVEDSFGRSGNTPIARAILIGSLITTDQLNANENSSSNDDSDSNNSEGEISKISNPDKPTDENDHNNDSRIVFITPNREVLSQDVFLDLKARSGFVRSGEGDIYGDSNVPETSTVENVPEINSIMRSGFVPADDNNMKPSDYLYNNLNRPLPTYSEAKLSQYNNPNNYNIPETMYNNMFNPRITQAQSPFHFGNFNSREMLYLTPNSHEIWPQKHPGQPPKSYFGNTFPSNQIYKTYRENCPKCTQGRFLSQNPSFRRTEVENDVLETNGRSVESDVNDGNAYPLVLDEAGVNQQTANDIVGLVPREGYGIQDIERNSHSSHVPADSSSSILTLPSYVSRSPSVMRRVGMGKIQTFVV